MTVLKKYYGLSFGFALAALIIGAMIGYTQAGVSGALSVALIVAVLGVLETSLSFDNAVVNARVLNNWDDKWRHRFLTWGILVAVFGMRIVFPIAIVSVATGTNPMAITMMALNNPDNYARELTSVHHLIAGFGGAFLFMVAFNFFFEEKHNYWIEAIEQKLVRVGALDGVSAALTLVGSLITASFFHDPQHGSEFAVAAVWGVVTYLVAHGLGAILGDDEGGSEGTGTVIKAGIAGFLYLELIDSSFSFDGVIGAFVLSTYLPVIALGLGVGAFFVRSMTVHMVDAGTLSEYRYLEHGAFYAILALAIFMYMSGLGVHLPEWLTGLTSGIIIIVAFLHSLHLNRKDSMLGSPNPAH